MKQALLVLDVHYLAHRAFHTSKDLSWKGKSTGVVFGLMKSISFFKDEFQTDRIAFCFEHPHSYRKEIYPLYKKKRHKVERTVEEQKSYEAFAIQISELRQRYLPKVGFRNVFSMRGLESDDIMAAIAAQCEEDEEVILITADGDLLQCLRPNVSIYNPQQRKLLTFQWFLKQYGFHPRRWAMVKAIAGCSSDEVQGIKGVGELTAIKYVQGILPEASKAYQAIRCHEGKVIVRRNRELVQLPFKGCPIPLIQEDKVSKKGWLAVCDMLGMRSLANRPPIASRKLMRI